MKDKIDGLSKYYADRCSHLLSLRQEYYEAGRIESVNRIDVRLLEIRGFLGRLDMIRHMIRQEKQEGE